MEGVEGSWVYMPCINVINKSTWITLDELNIVARCSCIMQPTPTMMPT